MTTGMPRSRAARELCVVLGFALLTAAMTWPWVAHLRDAVSDAGDPYLSSWVLWWDFHQTFHAPLRLFDGNIFFPLKDTLAFSEHDYGIALPFFPLLALGVRPLTVHGIATLLAFVFSGYGAFRLARTLTGSTAAAWIAGIAFAFTPYRFYQLPHLVYIFSGWIPLLLEALVLFTRQRSWRRAAWLGAAFLMNGLTCIHWLVLTLVPLAVLAAVLVTRERAARDPHVLRGVAALAVAGICLLPFLLPYQRAARAYGFTRSAREALDYSAEPRDWLRVDPHNKLWYGLGAPVPGERALFPGALIPACALLALLVPRRKGLPRTAVLFGLVLSLLGFAGSLGIRFFFHRLLFEAVPLFRSIRAPARWAMVAHMGLALLAAAGVLALVERLPRRAAPMVAALLALGFLFELRVAPMGGGVIHGAVDPDELTRALARTPMRGGLVEFPSGGARGNYQFVLRAADHGRPLVNGVSGFVPPHVARLEDLARRRPIPDALLDDLESIPASYVTLHDSWLDPWDRPAWHHFLSSALAAGRLRFVGRFDGRSRNDLYAVTKTEPEVTGSERPPWGEVAEATAPGRLVEDGRLLCSVDNPADDQRVAGRLLVRGWARMPGEDLEVTVAVDGEARPPVSFRRVPRPDVCRVFPNLTPCDTAGYEAVFDVRPDDPGPHELLVLFRAKDGRARHYPIRRFSWTP